MIRHAFHIDALRRYAITRYCFASRAAIDFRCYAAAMI